jgi:hypothetical protein
VEKSSFSIKFVGAKPVLDHKKRLDSLVTIVSSAGTKRVKPANDFMLRTNAISKIPATPSSTHGI